VTDISNVFQYGASESNGRSMGQKEQLDKSPGMGDVPPQRSGDRFDIPAEDPEGGGSGTTRLVLLALTIILLGTAAGLGAALVLPKTYGARAEVLYAVGQQQQSGDPLKQGRDLSTQLVYLKSRAVLGPVATKEGRQFKDLDKAVSVEVLENSNVIEVEADGPTKLAALQTLQSVMDGYMTLIGQPTGVSRNLDTQLADAKANTAQIQTRVQQLTTAVTAGTATQVALNDARAQLTASLDREKAIQARIDEINLTGQNGPDAQLLTPPYSLPDPVFPQPLIAAGTGALVGVIVAGAVVAMSVRRRTKP
jgi:capsular polysaccharide biosynthesis protein